MRRGELHAAGLAATADEDLGLDDDRSGARRRGSVPPRPAPGPACGRLPSRGRAGPGRRAGTWRRLPGSSRDVGSAGGDAAATGREGDGSRAGRRSHPTRSGTKLKPRAVASPYSSSAATSSRAAAEGRDAAGTRGASADGAIMTPSPSWQAPRSPGSTPPPGSSCAIRIRPRTPSRRRLVRAWRDLPTLRDPDRFDAWLHRLLYRACIDEARRLRRHRVDVELTDRSTRRPSPTARRRSPTATSSSVASAASSRRQRAVIVLHHYLDLPLPEVAIALGIPLGNGEITPAPRRSSRCERRSTPTPDPVRTSGGPARMTLHDGFDRTVSDWLDEQAGHGAPGYLDAVLRRTTEPTAPGLVEPRKVAPHGIDRPSRAGRPGSPGCWPSVGPPAPGRRDRRARRFAPAGPVALRRDQPRDRPVRRQPTATSTRSTRATNLAVPLIVGETLDSDPSYSPDGRRFTFARRSPGPTSLALMVANADGSERPDARPG